MKKKPLIYLAFVLLLSGGHQFCLAQQSLVPAGDDASGESGSISFSIGQLFISSDSNDSGGVSEGVQQPFETFIITSVYDKEYAGFEITAFPNPVQDYISIAVQGENMFDLHDLQLYLFDASGHLLEDQPMAGTNMRLDMYQHKTGMYFLQIYHQDKKIEVFKIIKE